MGKKRSLLQRVKAGMDIPEEILCADTIVELIGRRQARILQHKGILAYTNECICVRTKQGSIGVFGSGLELAQMNREKMVISGSIDKLEFSGRESE